MCGSRGSAAPHRRNAGQSAGWAADRIVVDHCALSIFGTKFSCMAALELGGCDRDRQGPAASVGRGNRDLRRAPTELVVCPPVAFVAGWDEFFVWRRETHPRKESETELSQRSCWLQPSQTARVLTISR